MRQLIFITTLLVCICSCKDRIKNAQLDAIGRIIKSYPDSALAVLDTLQLSSNNKFHQKRHLLYRVLAKDLSRQDISMDKEILDVYTFFKEEKHDKMAGIASFLSGRLLHENKNYEDAITYYNLAEEYAKQANDTGYVLYWTGTLLADQFMFDAAKAKLEEAQAVFCRDQQSLL